MNRPLLALARSLLFAAASSFVTAAPLPNGDFESDSTHWSLPAGASIADDTAPAPNHFLRLVSPASGAMVMLHRSVPVPASAQALELTWRWRVSQLKTGAKPWFDARVLLEFTDATHRPLSPFPEPVYANTDTAGWEHRSARIRVPADAAFLVLKPALFQAERGVLDLDDFSLAPLDPAILDAADALRADEERRRHVPAETADRSRWPAELHVEGNRLVDSARREILLRGVNVQGLESYPDNVWTLKSVLVGLDDWKANVIRLPVNDEFWFGRSGFQSDNGRAYRGFIDHAVMLAANRGAYLVLDLHHYRAPRAAHVTFWKDAAARYKDHPAVLFDLLNEPHDISWKIWRDGGPVGDRVAPDQSAFLSDEQKKANEGFESVGMQALVDAVRSTGAKNIVIAGGIDWSGDLSGVTEGHALSDPSGNGIMYSWHQYNWHSGWARRVLAVAEKHPVFVGEFGADVNKMNFIPADIQESPYTWVPDMLGFLQKHRLNWTAWCLHPHATPVMISDWHFTPTPFFGAFVKDALAGKQFDLKKLR